MSRGANIGVCTNNARSDEFVKPLGNIWVNCSKPTRNLPVVYKLSKAILPIFTYQFFLFRIKILLLRVIKPDLIIRL